jgi:hypothetical protein
LIRSVAVLIGGQFAGVFLDQIQLRFHCGDFAYRYIPAWQVVFQALSFIFLFLLYSQWKRLGGEESFVPPSPDFSDV